MDEARAIDAALGHAAPEIGRAQVAARLLDGVALGAGKLVLAHPAEVVVGGLDARPAVAAPFDGHGLAPQKLRHALGVVARLSAHSSDIDRAEHIHSELERAFGQQLAERLVLAELADRHKRVALLDQVGRLRAGDRLRVTQDRDHRDACLRTEPALGQRLPEQRAVVGTGTHSIVSSPSASSSSSTIFGRS